MNKRYLMPVFLLLSAQAAFSMDEQGLPRDNDIYEVSLMVQTGATTRTIYGSHTKIKELLQRFGAMAEENKTELVIGLLRIEKPGVMASSENILNPISLGEALAEIDKVYGTKEVQSPPLVQSHGLGSEIFGEE